MGTIWIRDFSGGLDARRMSETLRGNVLIKATNCHANSGGEFEKRAALVEAYSLPAGTKGLAATVDGLTVFGSVAEPIGMPSGVAYQRLVDPDTNSLLSRVLSTTNNDRKIFAVAEFASGVRHLYYDGSVVTDIFDGKARGQITVLDGTSGSSQLTELRVNGVPIIGATVTHTTSNENTAALIATAINSHASSPDYFATSEGSTVTITAADVGAAANGFVISYTVASSLSLSPDSGTGTMDNGADGTFDAGTYARTIGSKVYVLSGSLLNFSGIRKPTKFLTDTVGAGFIDFSSQDELAQVLKAVHVYQNYIAIFAENVTLIWYVDPDPTLNRKVQILGNIGTPAPKSVSPFGDNDLMLYHLSGVRSLRARDSSNAAITTDIGSPIDKLVKATFAALTTTEKDAVVSLTDPLSGRWWLVMNDVAYVFSYFGNSKISAWSQYDLTVDDVALDVTDAVVFDNKVWLRAGDKIYAFGGTETDLTYDASEADLRLPFMDADKPTQEKVWTAIDVACEGRWEVSANINPLSPESYDVIATVHQTTYGARTIPLGTNGITGTHISLKFRSTGETAAKIGAVVIHFDTGKDED